MKIAKPAGVFVRNEENAGQERARTREEPSESALAGVKRKLKDKLPGGPTSISLGVPAIFQGLSKTTGAAKPKVRGAPPPRVPISDKKLSASKMDKVNAKANLALDKMQSVHHPAKSMQEGPSTGLAMSDLAAYHREVAAMFGDTPAARDLGHAILQLVPPAGGDDGQPDTRPLKAPLMLATALSAVCQSNAPLAEPGRLLRELRAGVRTWETFSLQRVLASTAPGADALCKALNVPDERKEPFCDALRMCSALEKKGVDVDFTSSPTEVLQRLARDNTIGLDKPIGGDDDPPLRLLGKALRHANAAASGEPSGAGAMESAADSHATDKHAYVAWKKGGFVDSGKGSDFNKAIERLFKFSTYVDRADHGPRTFRNMVKEVGTLFTNMVGVGKSPLTMLRNGTSGSLGTMAQESARFKESLNDTMSPLRHHYHKQLSHPAVVADADRFHAALTRTAALDVWAGKGGRVNVAIAAAEVAARATELHGALAVAPEFDLEQLKTQLKSFATSHHTNQGELSVQFRLKTLKAVAKELVAQAPATDAAELADLRAESRALRSMPERTAEQNARLDDIQAQLLHHTGAAVTQARMIKSALVPTRNLFEFKDLYRMLTSAPPREGPTAAETRKHFQSISGGKLESMTRMEAVRSLGINVDPAIVLKPVALKAGLPKVPLVLPAVGHVRTRSAVVEAGDSLTGGRFYVGTQTAASTFGQFGAGLVIPLPKGGGVAVPLALLAGAYTPVEGEGACITTRIDVPGWEQKSAEVVDFMFDQAIPPQGQQRPQTPGEFWQRFSDKFGDDRNVTMSLDKNSAQVNAQTGVFAAAVRAPVGSDMTMGPTFVASLSRTQVSSQLNTEAVAADVPTSFEGTTISFAASVSVAQANPMAPLPSGDVIGLGTIVPYGNLRIDKNIDGQFGLGRIGRNADGTVAAFSSQRIVGFRKPDDMLAYVQSNLDSWVETLRDMDPRNRDPDNTDPANKQTTEGARALLVSFLQQIKHAPARGDINFGEFRTLQPAVAERISDYEARVDTLQGKGDGAASARALSEPARHEINQLQNEIHRLLSEVGSWRPTALYGLENVRRSESTGGIDLLAKVGGSRSISATRLTSLLIAALPDAAAPVVPDVPL